MDLFRTGTMDEQALARSRQQIVSLMQRFRFIRQCIKCSAKNLLRVDEVFLKAQQAVLYPFTPLFDLNTGRLTENCRRAFTRIFRMFDKDNDGLLSNAELDAFQYQTFRVPFVERDITGWKKVVSRNNPTDEAVVQDGKFTVAGFLAIFDVFISQNRLDLPWKVLRRFGYDDDLNLNIPATVTTPADDKSWKLSPSARQFLAAIFHQFDSDSDGVLSAEDVAAIFSIVPDPTLPPWHPARAPDVLEGCFSMPKQRKSSSGPGSPTSGSSDEPMAMSQSLSASGITICSATSLPTVDVSSLMQQPISKPLSFLDWMGFWHMISAISPSAARAELYRLGHVEDKKQRKESKKRSSRRKSAPAGADYSAVMLPSQEVRVLVLGSRGCGKTALLRALCEVNETQATFESSPTDTNPTKSPETSSAYVKLKREAALRGIKSDYDAEEFVVHLVFTEVPPAEPGKTAEQRQQLASFIGPTTTSKSRAYDLVMFTFDCSDDESLSYAMSLENSLLTDEVSRVYVATKTDSKEKAGSLLVKAADHCSSLDLEGPFLTSATEELLGAETESASTERHEALSHLARCALQENGMCLLKARPHAERKRKEAAKRRKMIWLGGLAVGVSVVVAVGVGVLWGSGSVNKGERRDRLGWFRQLFG
jgi:Ras family protein T1